MVMGEEGIRDIVGTFISSLSIPSKKESHFKRNVEGASSISTNFYLQKFLTLREPDTIT